MTGTDFLGFLVHHHGHADTAVRVAAAAQLAPIGIRSVNEVGPVGEGGHKGDREPVAGRLAHAHLVLHVVREVRQRVSLSRAAFVSDFFVAARERNGLEGEEGDLLRIVERELNHRANLLVIHAVDDGDDRDDVDAGECRFSIARQLHVKQVADGAVGVGGVADAVELEVSVTEAGFGSLLAEFRALGELDAVGCGLHAVVADLAGIATASRK